MNNNQFPGNEPQTSMPNPNMMPNQPPPDPSYTQQNPYGQPPINKNFRADTSSPFANTGYNGPQPGKNTAIVGLVISIIALVLAIMCMGTFWIPVFGITANIIALVCAIVGLVLGVRGGNKNSQIGAPKGGFSVGAIVCGIIAVILSGILMFCSIASISLCSYVMENANYSYTTSI